MTQWHPIFGHLLRPVLQDYYDVQTNVPVGDLPREADILVLQRASTGKPPFRSLWRHLNRWRDLESAGDGLWRGYILGHPLWLVSNRDVPIDRESVPLHLVSDEPVAKARELAQVVVSEDDSWRRFGAWLHAAYPNVEGDSGYG